MSEEQYLVDARIQANKLREMYAQSPQQNSIGVLLTGESGTGKTHLLRTARKPVHVDSFDPGGTLVLRDLIEQGSIIADTLYEQEDRTKPTMFHEWERTFTQRVNKKYFEAIGTYCLDSSTMWADAIMSYIMSKDKRAGEAPNFYKDFNPQKIIIQNWIKRILALPCDVIVTGHLEGEYETRTVAGEETKSLVKYKYMTTGKGAVIIPLLFSEQWTMFTQEKPGGVQYVVLTAPYRLYRARTRIGREKFKQFEEPNIKALLAKANMNTKDKPQL